MKNSKAGFCIGSIEADDIGISQGAGSYKLLLPQIFNRFQSVTQASSQFEIKLIRGGNHLCFDSFCYLLIITLQQLLGLFHRLNVFCLTFSFLTPATAQIHMVIEARAIFSNVFRELLAAVGEL